MELNLTDIKNVLILGSGTLGLRVGLQAAISGFDTIIYDIHEGAFVVAKNTQASILKNLVNRGILSQEEADATVKRLTFTTDATKAGANADFVSESVVEDLEIKRKVWKRFASLCPPHALFTTNTSFLLSSQFAADTGRPERFCAFHFHDVFWANVVDIMPHAETAHWVPDLLIEMGKKLQQTPVLVKTESPGYLFNAMLMALIGAAGALVTYDVASIEDVDRSWMGNFKMEMGPFGILDSVGLETVWHITSTMPDTKSKKFSALLKQYVDAGKLGVKTGEGFYKYPNPAFKEKNFIHKY